MSYEKQISEPLGIHLMAKPAGPLCNLNCNYCFYIEKKNLYPEKHHFMMSDDVLREYIEKNIKSEPGPEVLFTWQGGEPLLRGIDFFKKAVSYQKKTAQGRAVKNSLQTNGVLLDDEWCRFFFKNNFLIGVSLDGPEKIHNRERVDKKGRATFDEVMNGISLMKKHNVQFNVLATVSSTAAGHGLEIYRFLKKQGVEYIQFSPVVERMPGTPDQAMGLKFATPPSGAENNPGNTEMTVSPQTVGSEEYGDFLIAVFDEWIRNDIGKVFVMNFEWALASWMQMQSPVCIFGKDCGRALILEHNGDIYSCDHFMYPDYLLGNIRHSDPAELADSEKQKKFGLNKSASLPSDCRECNYLFACNGECPKNRFIYTENGEPGLNYLCAGYKKYFRHITHCMNDMAKLISHNQDPSLIMDAFKGPLVVKLPADS